MSNQENDNEKRRLSGDRSASPQGGAGDAASKDEAGAADVTPSAAPASRSPAAETPKEKAARERAAAAEDEAKNGTAGEKEAAASGAAESNRLPGVSRPVEVPGDSRAAGAAAASGGGGASVSGSGRPFERGDMRPEHRPKSGGGGGGSKIPIALLALLLLAACVLGGWFLYQHYQRLEQQGQRLEALRSSVEQSQQSSSNADRVSSDLESQERRLDHMQSQLQDNRQALERAMQAIASEAQNERSEERVLQSAEIAYLLRMANQRLQLERDVGGALTLLETADRRLQQIDDPAFLPVRRAVASEISALEAVPEVDESGLYLRLAALSDRLDALPLSQQLEGQTARQDSDEAFSGGWREQLARLGSQLQGLITVRRHDEPLEALVTPTQESYLRQNVRLLIEHAQLALMNGNGELYSASLNRAQSLVSGYFRSADERVVQFNRQLGELAARSISPELPDISGSVSALDRVQERATGEGRQGDAAQERGQGSTS